MADRPLRMDGMPLSHVGIRSSDLRKLAANLDDVGEYYALGDAIDALVMTALQRQAIMVYGRRTALEERFVLGMVALAGILSGRMTETLDAAIGTAHEPGRDALADAIARLGVAAARAGGQPADTLDKVLKPAGAPE